MIKLPMPVKKALYLLQNEGHGAYVVGGCVRDALLGNEPSDWDIATSAKPDVIQRVFCDYRTIPTGLQHGTVTVLVDGLPLEITTYRVDGDYTDGRHPNAVAFTTNLIDDLSRRDFTVNAMAYSGQDGLIDPYNGKLDLGNQLIRCVGDPLKRFGEDALRLLRALRFASVLGFAIEHRTADAIHALPHLLSQISAERIATEWKKLLLGSNAMPILREYVNVWSVILPEVSPDQFRRVAEYIGRAPYTLTVRLALLFIHHEQPEEAAKGALRRLRFDNRTIDAVATLLRYREAPIEDDVCLRRLLGNIGYDRLRDLLALRIAVCNTASLQKAVSLSAAMIEKGVCCDLRCLAIDGKDLLTIGYPAGPAIGAELQRLLDAVIEERYANQREVLLSLAREHMTI